MRYTALQYSEALYEAIRGKNEAEVKEIIVRFVIKMNRQGLIALLPEIQKKMPLAIKKVEGIEDVIVETAHAIKGDIESLAVKALNKKATEVELDVRINPAVLGGIKVRGKDTVYDATLKNKIDRLREAFVRAE